MNKFWTVLVASALVLGSVQADAARLGGGGKSFGRQSGNVTQRQATVPPTPTSPAQSASPTAPRPATPTPAAAAPKRPWGAMLGGLAAGLGLAWLAHSLGLGAGFGNILMIGLLVLAAVVAWRMFSARSRNGGSAGGSRQGGLAFEGAGNPANVSVPAQYSPSNVGNDASARPWERATPTAFDALPAANSGVEAERLGGSSLSAAGAAAGAVGGSMIGSALAGSQSWGIPTGFDVDGFLSAAKRNFVTLQDAWDRADVSMLRTMMTDGMVEEIRTQLADRAGHTGGASNKTDVVALDAKLLGIEELPDVYLASVEFSGMIREDASADPSPFREVWNMTKSASGTSGWLVAGVQALQ